MSDKLPENKLITELRDALIKIIEQLRMHIWQMCLVAGAIAAFLMPLYASPNFSQSQHAFLALSLVSFLLCILIGFLHVSFKLTDDQRNLNTMKYCLENKDFKRSEKLLKKIRKPIEEQNSIDIISWFVDILFAAGVMFLITAIILTEYKIT